MLSPSLQIGATRMPRQRTTPTRACTPPLIILKLFLLHGSSENDSLNCYDDSVAFLPAEPMEEVYAIPPVELYPDGGVLWNLGEAKHGITTAPNA